MVNKKYKTTKIILNDISHGFKNNEYQLYSKVKLKIPILCIKYLT
jgi:hypothetical protein